MTRTLEKPAPHLTHSQLINCIAKRKSKKAAARAAAAGGGAVGGHTRNNTLFAFDSFHGSENTELTPPVEGLANGIGKSGSSSRLKFLGARQRAGEKYAAGDTADDAGAIDGGGRGVGRHNGPARGASPSPRGAVVGTALPVIGGGTALRGTVNRGAVRGRGDRGTESPMWGRRAGADEHRSDVTPGRLRQGLRENGGGTKHPRPASGAIPEDWVAEGKGSEEIVSSSGGAAAGGAGGGGGGTALAAATSAADRKSSDGHGPARISSVDLAIERAIALSAGAAATAFDNESSVASPNTRDGFRDSRDVWMGGASTVGSARYAGDRRVGGDDVSSVGSQDSALPPSMAGLRLNTRTIEEADVADTGLPSYEEAVRVVAPYEWRV